MKLPKVPVYNRHISQLCLRRKITACSVKLERAAARSFMPNQAASEHTSRNGSQMKPAFCRYSVPPSAIVCGLPAMAPNRPMVITSGMTNWVADTPRLPRPAFMPSA